MAAYGGVNSQCVSRCKQNVTMRRLLVVFVSMLLLLGCRQTVPATTLTAPTASPAATVDGAPTPLPADALAGKRFVSVEEREVGLGPNGAEMGHWTLEFGADSVTWLYSDISERGGYELRPDGTIVAHLGPEGELEATYDAARDRVHWEGMWYERGE